MLVEQHPQACVVGFWTLSALKDSRVAFIQTLCDEADFFGFPFVFSSVSEAAVSSVAVVVLHSTFVGSDCLTLWLRVTSAVDGQ